MTKYMTPAQQAAADPQVEAMMAAEASHPAPSTNDAMFAIAGGQDPVLATLIEAYERYYAGAVRNNYIGTSGVCAAGALMQGDEGILNRARGLIVGERKEDDDDAMALDYLASEVNVVHLWEDSAIEATKEALRLLNETAIEHFRDELLEVEGYEAGDDVVFDANFDWGWPFGPIEALNQALDYHDTVYKHEVMPYFKATVLSVYDKAIESRQAAQPA